VGRRPLLIGALRGLDRRWWLCGGFDLSPVRLDRHWEGLGSALVTFGCSIGLALGVAGHLRGTLSVLTPFRAHRVPLRSTPFCGSKMARGTLFTAGRGLPGGASVRDWSSDLAWGGMGSDRLLYFCFCVLVARAGCGEPAAPSCRCRGQAAALGGRLGPLGRRGRRSPAAS